MKKIVIITVISLLACFIQGCDKNFLDRDPLDKLSSNQFWQTKQDFDMALTAIYGNLQTPMFSAGTPDWDLITDNGYGQHNSNGSQAIVRGDIFSSSDGYIRDVYKNCYAGIARVNIFLSKLGNYEGSAIDETAKKIYVGEASFMRAYYYYLLYTCYGDVPLVKEPLTLENQIQPKVPATEVLDFILNEVDEAIANLPNSLYKDAKGHLVKSSAQALKLRILLFIAYGQNGNVDLEIIKQAKNVATEIMQAGYQLSPQFESIFRSTTQEGNPEIIFSVKFLAPDNATSMDQWYGDWLVASPLKSFYDAFEANDKRRDQTVFVGQVDFNGNIHKPSNNVPTGYGLKKFLSPDLIPYGYSTQSEQDWIMFRYAEVLLSFAEAENELSGPTIAVHDVINSLRLRSGLGNLSKTLTKDEMRIAIRKERRMELAFEGFRYFDLKRWHIAEEVLNNVKDGILTYKFEDKFYKWPLPQTEIDRSQGVLIQNPSY
ncbi:RagB/SusD family nutrient uptake outer membrane protein [Sphingobacterium faecium]